MLTLLILTVSKLTSTPHLLQVSSIISPNMTKLEVSTLDLGRSDSMPVMCGVVSMLDHLLVTSLTYYLASLFIYLFCRKPNPDIPTTSEMTLRVSDFEKFNPITFYILETTSGHCM